MSNSDSAAIIVDSRERTYFSGPPPQRLRFDNRVSDELPRSVIGDLAPAVSVVHLDSETLQLIVGCEDVVHTAPASQSIDVWVFQQDQSVGPVSGGHLRVEALLEVEGFRIGNEAQTVHLALAHRR